VLSALVAAVKCRSVLHHSAVLFFWPSGIMDCMLFTFENIPAYALPGVSRVASLIDIGQQPK